MCLVLYFLSLFDMFWFFLVADMFCCTHELLRLRREHDQMELIPDDY